MITEIGQYYLYRHIRLDKNESFYIGVGSKNKYNEFKRAYSKLGRNIIWKAIVKKSNFIVEILIESNSKNFILEKEKEFIKLYGRKDIGTGTLANLTDGGEVFPEKCTGNFGIDNPISKKIIQYDLEGNFLRTWVSLKEAANFYKFSPESLGACVRINELKNKESDIYATSHNYIWIKQYDNFNLKILPLLKLIIPIIKKKLRVTFECYYKDIKINKLFFTLIELTQYLHDEMNVKTALSTIRCYSKNNVKNIKIIKKKNYI